MKNVLLLLSTVLIFIGCSTNNNGTVTVVPIAPTNLTGSVISTSQVNLSWTDNATNEDGFKIERKSGSGSYSVVGSMGSNLTTFSDLGLTPNTTYTYRVYAYNSAGNSLQYSNEVTVTTQDNIPSWLTNGLVAFYPFSGNAGDSSGNGNHGTVNGATLTTDRFGNTNSAYNFNNNLITIPNQNYLGFNNNSQFSVSIWIYKTGNQSTVHFIGKRPNGAQNTFWQMYTCPGIAFQSFNNGIKGCYAGNLVTCPINIWVNLVGTFENGNWRLYLNGNILSENTDTTIFDNDNNAPLTIGNSGGFEPFYGSLDDIRIYNRALSQSEVQYLYSH